MSTLQPAEASQAQQMTMTQLHQSILNAIDTRERRYERVFAFAIRFEQDDSEAMADSIRFCGICEILGLPRAKEIVLKNYGPVPARDELGALVRQLGRTTEEVKGQSLIIVHYAGHASVKKDGSFYLISHFKSRHEVFFETTFDSLWRHHDIFERTDAMLILDCCFSGIATRFSSSERDRTVEIIAAVGQYQEAFPGSYRHQTLQTFTARLDAEVSKAVGKLQGKPGSISMLDIISSMRSNPARVPEYKLKLGCLPIFFTVERSTHSLGTSQPIHRRQTSSSTQQSPLTLSPSSDPAPPVRYGVSFTATVNECDIENGEHREIVAWLRSAGPSVGLELNSVYKSRSFILFFHGNWTIWAALNGLNDFRFQGETFGENLLNSFALAASKLTMKENIPLRQNTEKK